MYVLLDKCALLCISFQRNLFVKIFFIYLIPSQAIEIILNWHKQKKCIGNIFVCLLESKEPNNRLRRVDAWEAVGTSSAAARKPPLWNSATTATRYPASPVSLCLSSNSKSWEGESDWFGCFGADCCCSNQAQPGGSLSNCASFTAWQRTHQPRAAVQRLLYGWYWPANLLILFICLLHYQILKLKQCKIPLHYKQLYYFGRTTFFFSYQTLSSKL